MQQSALRSVHPLSNDRGDSLRKEKSQGNRRYKTSPQSPALCTAIPPPAPGNFQFTIITGMQKFQILHFGVRFFHKTVSKCIQYEEILWKNRTSVYYSRSFQARGSIPMMHDVARDLKNQSCWSLTGYVLPLRNSR